jgi:hypothetical protein
MRAAEEALPDLDANPTNLASPHAYVFHGASLSLEVRRLDNFCVALDLTA